VLVSGSEIGLVGFLVGSFLHMGLRDKWCFDRLVKNWWRDIVDTSTHAFGLNERVRTNGAGFSPYGEGGWKEFERSLSNNDGDLVGFLVGPFLWCGFWGGWKGVWANDVCLPLKYASLMVD
jgi:hypothetical protein